MKFTINSISPKLLRIFITIVTIAALVPSVYMFINIMVLQAQSNDECLWEYQPDKKMYLISRVVKGGVADQAHIKDGDYLVRFNSKPFSHRNDAIVLLNSAHLNEIVTYTILRDNIQFDVKIRIIKVFDFAYFSLFLLGFGFLVVGYTVGMTKPNGELQFRFWVFGLITMIYFAVQNPFVLELNVISLYLNNPAKAMNIIWTFKGFMSLICWLTFFAARLLAPPVFILFFTKFPIDTAPNHRKILSITLISVTTCLILLTPTFLFIGLPVSFGFSIFKYGLMDIDAIVRRSLVYGGLTAGMAGIYLLTVIGVGSVLESSFGLSESRLLNVIALLAIAFALDPMKRRAQDAIDKMFYQERLNYQKALLEFSRELPSKINIREILQTTMQRITTTMHVETVVAAMFDNFAMEKIIPPDYYTPDNDEGSLYKLMLERKAPLYFADANTSFQTRLNSTEYERINQFGIALTVPMMLKDKLIGTINVGKKLNGKPFSQEDIDLLLTVASQAAVAIENARLHLSELDKVKIQEEFALARAIQKQLLPKCNPSIQGLDLCASNEPALIVGGDYYDYIPVSDSKLLVVVADVSGKGMSAALYMSKIQGMMHLAAHLYTSPKEILTHVNRHLYSTLDRKSFISLILALFDTEAKTVTICRAGQTLPLLCLNGHFEYLHTGGLALGLVKGDLFASKLEEITVPFVENNTLIFYTDGVTEAHNSSEDQFGEENLLTLVNSKKFISASETEAAICHAVIQFQGDLEQHDDRTIVVVRAIA
ncbi:MAG: SpoIIE family protein phosphatase [Ignavibacteriae bacterium]|nr:SpoIIE family protein phosphatase [Ignavibacteriota bacterium]